LVYSFVKPQIKIWVTFIIIFILNQLYEIFGGRIFLLYCYLDDFLFFPIIFTLTLLIQQRMRSREYIIPIHYIIGFSIILSLLMILLIYYKNTLNLIKIN